MSKTSSFRVGRVTAYLRGQVWYLRYHENGQRHQVRGGHEKKAVRRLAAEVNAQLETGAPVMTSIDSVTVPELRELWLEHHEHVLQSSVATLNRYRTATDHLLGFIEQGGGRSPRVSSFRPTHAEQFVRYLRQLKVAPNGHANATRRPLRGKGIKYVLQVCRSLFNFALKRRYLPPYADNPFSVIEIDRMPADPATPHADLSKRQERQLLAACDEWQLPVFLTLVLTGLRPGELSHLMLPEDLDLIGGWLKVRNKPQLGWQVKTRSERKIPLVPELVAVLKLVVGDRRTGPAFLRRRFADEGTAPALADLDEKQLQHELERRVLAKEETLERPLTREERRRLAWFLWRDAGAIKPTRLRCEFIRLTKQIGLPALTAPKTLRHQFATALQDANVDPLIRNQLMGHAPARAGYGDSALGMTGVYTHTRPETMRRQLTTALKSRPAVEVARTWVGMQNAC